MKPTGYTDGLLRKSIEGAMIGTIWSLSMIADATESAEPAILQDFNGRYQRPCKVATAKQQAFIGPRI
jgi:hypothetical protein